MKRPACHLLLPAWLIAGLLLSSSACGDETKAPAGSPPPAAEPAAAAAPAAPLPFTYYNAEIVSRFPHDPEAFTQGLLFENAHTLLESTGLHGQSSLRRVDLKTGRVLKKVDLPARFFGEGLALLNGRLYQLTWKARTGFIYDAATLEKTGEFTYTGQGWGLTTDGTSLILSDGSHLLRFLDPATFAVTRTVPVMHQGKPVQHLNELEFIDGSIFANLWGTDLIARIDPATGQSTGVINCGSIFPASARTSSEQVLNGIAWHPETKRLLITGKWWPEIFEIRLRPIPPR